MRFIESIRPFALHRSHVVLQVSGVVNSSERSVWFQEKRLRDRKTESEESLQKRLKAAKVDMEFSKYLLAILSDISVKYMSLNIFMSF